MSNNFVPSVYKPQFSSGNPHVSPNAADIAYDASLAVSFNAAQVYLAGFELNTPDKTRAALVVLLNILGGTPVSAATVASLGLTSAGWIPGTTDWTTGYSNMIAQTF
jgi:hypothetical protein